jgi:hypothetical protein
LHRFDGSISWVLGAKLCELPLFWFAYDFLGHTKSRKKLTRFFIIKHAPSSHSIPMIHTYQFHSYEASFTYSPKSSWASSVKGYSRLARDTQGTLCNLVPRTLRRFSTTEAPPVSIKVNPRDLTIAQTLISPVTVTPQGLDEFS